MTGFPVPAPSSPRAHCCTALLSPLLCCVFSASIATGAQHPDPDGDKCGSDGDGRGSTLSAFTPSEPSRQHTGPAEGCANWSHPNVTVSRPAGRRRRLHPSQPIANTIHTAMAGPPSLLLLMLLLQLMLTNGRASSRTRSSRCQDFCFFAGRRAPLSSATPPGLPTTPFPELSFSLPLLLLLLLLLPLGDDVVPAARPPLRWREDADVFESGEDEDGVAFVTDDPAVAAVSVGGVGRVTAGTAIAKRECTARDQSALRTRSASHGPPRLAALASRVSWTWGAVVRGEK